MVLSAVFILKVPPNYVSNEDHANHCFKNEWTLVSQICFLELYEEANWSSYLAIQQNGEVNIFFVHELVESLTIVFFFKL